MQSPPVTVITSESSSASLVGELWRHRFLIYSMALRDITVRYRQTALGILWALIKPLSTALVLTFVFKSVARMQSSDVPYTLFVLSGVLVWQYFTSIVTEGVTFSMSNANMITKVYFPRAVLPLSTIPSAACELLAGSAILLVLCLWHGYYPTLRWCAIPVALLLVTMAGAGATLFLTAATIRYRDLRFVTPLVLNLGFLLTPVGYSFQAFSAKWQPLAALNPASVAINTLRWSLFGHGAPDLVQLSTAVGATIFLALLGVAYFQRNERDFAELI